MKYKIQIFLFSIVFSVSAFAQNDWNVYVFIAEDCPISIYMVQPLQKVLEQHTPNTTFYAVFPSILSTPETAQEFLDQYQLNAFNIRLDPEQKLTNQLEASVTPEAIITNQSGEVLYRGRISDAFAAPGKMKHGPRVNVLDQALTNLSQGKPVARPWVAAVGCYISYKPKSDD